MSLYSEFSEHYEEVFPLREEIVCFLQAHTTQKGENILDLGCGPGHYCGRLQQDGFSALGIDLDEKMISAARNKYPEARFYCLDVNGIDTIDERFHTIYSIGNVMAHIPHSQLRSLLFSIKKLLYPGGYWIFQVVNWDYLLKLPQYTFPVKSLAGGTITFHREYEEISEEQVMFHVFMQSANATLFDEKLRLYPLRSNDYLNLHSAAGFHPVGLYADFNKKEYRKKADSGAIFVFSKDRSSSTS